MWVSCSHYNLHVNNSAHPPKLLLHNFTTPASLLSLSHSGSDSEAQLFARAPSRANLKRFFLLFFFWKIITWSSSFNTSEVCFHLAPVIFFPFFFTQYPLHNLPKSVIFKTGKLFTPRCWLLFKNIFGWVCMGKERWKRLKDTAAPPWTLACFALFARLLGSSFLPGSFSSSQKLGIISD